MTTPLFATQEHGAALPQLYTGGELPPTWPDRSGWRLFLSLLRSPFVTGGEVEVPPALPGPPVPAYARKPFHGLPNGYYSHSVAEGYDTGFEISMLGRVRQARLRMVDDVIKALATAPGRVLDIGCGTARLADAFLQRGAREVWGLDPSPYLLQIAKTRSPRARLVQGVVEECPFDRAYFDAVGACFLFHELPRDVAAKGLVEIRRVLRPGGILSIVDPCPDHLRPSSLWRLFVQHGPAALYFHLLAKRVYEPFLDDWHGRADHAAWLSQGGFEVITREVKIPMTFLLARRRPDSNP